MRCFAFLLFAACVFCGQSSSAFATACDPTSSPTPCVKKECAKVGVTTMDNDQKNIIACLKNDSGALVWKSNSGGESCLIPYPTNVCGSASGSGSLSFYSINDGVYTYLRYQGGSPVIATVSNLYKAAHYDACTGKLLNVSASFGDIPDCPPSLVGVKSDSLIK
mgnify:CR=1 FL=1|jgi:hypothetical protein